MLLCCAAWRILGTAQAGVFDNELISDYSVHLVDLGIYI